MKAAVNKIKYFRSFRIHIEPGDPILLEIMSKHYQGESPRIVNLGHSGIGLESDFPFEHQEIVDLKLSLKSNIFHLKGKVVRCQWIEGKYNTGIQFFHDGIEDLEFFIRSLIDSFSLKRIKKELLSLLVSEHVVNNSQESMDYEKISVFIDLLLNLRSLTKDTSEFLDVIVKELGRQLNAQFVSIHLLLDEDSNTLSMEYPRCKRGVEQGTSPFFDQLFSHGQIVNSRRLVNDEEDDFYDAFHEILGVDVDTLLAFPIYDGEGHIIGLVNALNKSGGELFDEHDEQAVHFLSLLYSSLYKDFSFEKDEQELEEFESLSEKRLIGDSTFISNIRKKINQLASDKSSILIIGPQGAGKFHLAQVLHSMGPRHYAPCGVLFCEKLKKDATDPIGKLDVYAGGTFILHNICSLDFFGQSYVYELLKGKDYIHLLATTSLDLEEKMQAGHFLKPLYNLIAQTTLEVPALNKRPDDIAPLLQYFIAQECMKKGLIPKKVTTAFISQLLSPFPKDLSIDELKKAAIRLVTYNATSHYITKFPPDIFPLFNYYQAQKLIYEELLGGKSEEELKNILQKFESEWTAQQERNLPLEKKAS